ncbi:hypothetical protein DDR33_13455 [Pararcticibacter amylolyticus]|uniref:Uncharacterized protein n=1 Tax=Pararcticibacter amylolyticus TaxID=2173175 RepID=A0A2U2PFU3_9SPHI|nr:hypothetical protein DDR33_13455 [Pararcticibacter amylolyticus]
MDQNCMGNAAPRRAGLNRSMNILSKKNLAMARTWYAYNGIGLARDSGSYIYSPVPPLCTAGWDLCAVYAEYSGSLPASISNNLRLYIAAGRVTGLPQPQTPPGSKKFVYMKP